MKQKIKKLALILAVLAGALALSGCHCFPFHGHDFHGHGYHGGYGGGYGGGGYCS